MGSKQCAEPERRTWSVFDGAADGLFARKVDRQGAIAWAPALESFMQADEVVIRCDIPGVDPSDVRVKVEGQLLTITGSESRRKPRSHSRRGP